MYIAITPSSCGDIRLVDCPLFTTLVGSHASVIPEATGKERLGPGICGPDRRFGDVFQDKFRYVTKLRTCQSKVIHVDIRVGEKKLFPNL